MAEKEIAFSVKVNADGSKKTLNDLEKDFERLSDQIKDVAVDSKEFDKLSKELAQVGREVKNAELAFESLDTDQVAGELGSVAGAVGDVSAAFVLLGDESETMEEIAKNIETALGVSMAFKGAIEGVSSARKLLNNSTMVSNTLEKINAFVKGGSAAASTAVATAEAGRTTATTAATTATAGATAGLNLFRLALIGTGIGAVVVGLILLIQNFDKVKESVKDAVQWLFQMKDRLLELGPVINTIIGIMTLGLVPIILAMVEAIEYFGVVETEEMEKSRKRRAKQLDTITRETEKKVALIQKEIDAEKKKADEITSALDWEIEKKKAAGEDYAELEKQKLEAIIRTTREQAKLLEQQIRAEAEALVAKNKIIAQGTGFAATVAQKALEEFGDGSSYIEQLIGNDESLNALNETLDQAEKDLELFNIKQEKLKKDQIKKDAEAQKKANEDELKAEQEHQNKMLEIEKSRKQKELEEEKKKQDALDKLLEDYRVRNLSDIGQEMDALKKKFEEELEIAKGNKALQLKLEEEYERNKKDILDKFAEERKQDEEEEQMTRMEKAEALSSGLSDLNNAVLEAELAAAGDNEKKKQEIRKRAFKRQKALDLADATIQGIKAVQSALASPFPFNIALAAINGATAAANIAKIASVQFEGSGGGGATGGDLGNTARATQGANVPTVTNTTTSIGEPTKVFVTEQDITNTQNKVTVAENQATL